MLIKSGEVFFRLETLSGGKQTMGVQKLQRYLLKPEPQERYDTQGARKMKIILQ